MKFSFQAACDHIGQLAKKHDLRIIWHDHKFDDRETPPGYPQGAFFSLPADGVKHHALGSREEIVPGLVIEYTDHRAIIALHNDITEFGYFAALHEMGHCVYPKANPKGPTSVLGLMNPKLVLAELEAWRFAADNGIFRPSAHTNEIVRLSLESYIKNARRAWNSSSIVIPDNDFFHQVMSDNFGAAVVNAQ